jgi:hypothetical protein
MWVLRTGATSEHSAGAVTNAPGVASTRNARSFAASKMALMAAGSDARALVFSKEVLISSSLIISETFLYTCPFSRSTLHISPRFCMIPRLEETCWCRLGRCLCSPVNAKGSRLDTAGCSAVPAVRRMCARLIGQYRLRRYAAVVLNGWCSHQVVM